jgi:hypothetical protein
MFFHWSSFIWSATYDTPYTFHLVTALGIDVHPQPIRKLGMWVHSGDIERAAFFDNSLGSLATGYPAPTVQNWHDMFQGIAEAE